MTNPKRHTPFNYKSRKRRKKAYINIKNDICRHTALLGGLFFTDHQLHDNNTWLDLYFTGHKSPIFYNVELITLFQAYKDEVWEKAWQKSYQLAPNIETIKFEYIKNKKTASSHLLPREPQIFVELENLSRMEWCQRQFKIIADSSEVKVSPGWDVHYDYAYGIGVTAAVNAPNLTIDVIHQFIEQFLANPVNWHDDSAITYPYDQALFE